MSAKEIKSLKAQIAKLSVSVGKTKPRPARKRRNKRTKKVSSQGDCTVVISRSELVHSCTTGADGLANGNVNIRPDSFSFLKGFAKSFDRTKWQRVAFSYRPAVGTTVGGLISMGVDWDFSSNATTRAKICGLSPNVSFACWENTEKRPLVLPSSRLMSRDWYSNSTTSVAVAYDTGPGILSWAVEAPSAKSTVVGEIWVDYTVTMCGTNPA